MAYSRIIVFYHTGTILENFLNGLCEDIITDNHEWDGYHIHARNIAALDNMEFGSFDGLITPDCILIDKDTIAMSYLNATKADLDCAINSLIRNYFSVANSNDLLMADVSFHI